MLTRGLSQTIGLLTMVLLARLVSPADFGRAAVALIFVPLAGILTFEGFASALVQREEIDERHCRSAMLTSLVGGAALTLLVLILTPLLWRPVFGSRTAGLIVLVAPVFLLASFGSVSRALLWRNLDFRRMGLIELISMTLGNVVPVILALDGMGAPALVIGALVQTLAMSVLLFAAAPAPLPRWHRGAQREISRFGVPAALAGLVDVLFRNVDYAILAAQLPAATVGVYWRAFNLGVVYQDKLSGVMMQLAFPVYSRTESREELRRLHERAARVHAAVIFPLLASLIVLAPVLVPFLLGAAWTPSVRPTQILAVAGMIAAILTGYPQVMLAIGRARALMHFNVGMLVTYAAAVAIAAHHGLITIAIAVVAVYFAILVGVYRLLLQRYVGISIRQLIPELGPAIVGCLALAAVGEPVRHVLEPLIPRVLTITIAGTGGILTYAAALRVVSPSTWGDLGGLSARVLPRPRRASAAVPAPATTPAGS